MGEKGERTFFDRTKKSPCWKKRGRMRPKEERRKDNLKGEKKRKEGDDLFLFFFFSFHFGHGRQRNQEKNQSQEMKKESTLPRKLNAIFEGFKKMLIEKCTLNSMFESMLWPYSVPCLSLKGLSAIAEKGEGSGKGEEEGTRAEEKEEESSVKCRFELLNSKKSQIGFYKSEHKSLLSFSKSLVKRSYFSVVTTSIFK